MTEMELEKARHQTITKANDLIQRSRFDLSALQQKVILYLISQIQPTDTDFTTYEFNISKFCQVCGINNESGGNYAMLKKLIKEIADKSVWVTLEDGTETLLRWIERPHIKRKSGTIQLKLDELMKPYLLQQKANYTNYELMWVLQLERKYSIALYELIKSIHYHELSAYERIYDLEELRRLMGAENYKTWQHFKERALDPAIEEINAYTNKVVEYEPVKYGRVVGRIKLKVAQREYLEAMTNRRIK